MHNAKVGVLFVSKHAALVAPWVVGTAAILVVRIGACHTRSLR